MTQIFLQTVLALFAAGVGGFVGYHFRQSQDTKKHYKGVLYTLLELYKALVLSTKLTAESYFDDYISVIEDKTGAKLSRDDPLCAYVKDKFVAPQMEVLWQMLDDWDDEKYVGPSDVLPLDRYDEADVNVYFYFPNLWVPRETVKGERSGFRLPTVSGTGESDQVSCRLNPF